MTKKLSDLNASLTFVPSALSPMPAGTLQAYGGSTVPEGWLEADGTAVSRSTYADLFAAISTTYGVGDGSTTFNLPTGGPPVTEEWVNAGMVPGDFTNVGTVTAVDIQKKVIGSDLYLKGKFTTGTVSGSGNFEMALPDSLTIKQDFTGPTPLGVLSSSVASANRHGFLLTDGDQFLELGFLANSSAGGTTAQLGNALNNTTDYQLNVGPIQVAELSGLGISIIKAYPDSSSISMSIKDATATDTGAVRLSSDFAATETAYGFAKLPNGTIRLDTGGTGAAGHGTTNTKIRRFVNETVATVGDAFTYADTAADGMSITVNRDCIANVSYIDSGSTGNWMGLTVNDSSLATTIQNMTYAQGYLGSIFTPAASGAPGSISVTLKFSSGDVIRAKTAGTINGTTRTQFVIQEVYKL